MKRTARALAVVVTAATLTLTGQAVTTSVVAKPASGAHAQGGKSDVAKSDIRKVVRAVERKKTQLGRTVRENRVRRLDDAGAVLANVALDVADLDALLAAATAADAVVDLRQVRRDLRSFRVENYRIVVNILRHAQHLGATATGAGDAAASALVTEAVAAAGAVRATSPKSDLRAARALLKQAAALLEVEEEAEPVEETEPVEEAEPVEETDPVTEG